MLDPFFNFRCLRDVGIDVDFSRIRATKYLDFVVMINPTILDFNIEGFFCKFGQ